MWQLISKEFRIDQLLLEESLFSIGNGYVGARGSLEEAPALISDTIRGSYINGYYDRVPVVYGESAYGFPTEQDKQPRIMDTQTMLILLDGEAVKPDNSRIKNYSRCLDMQNGLLSRSYIYTTQKGKEAKISFKRLASFEYKSLLSYEIQVTYDGEIEVNSYLDSDVSNHSDANDPRVGSNHEKLLNTVKLFVENGIGFCEMVAHTSQIPVLCLMEHKVKTREPVPCVISTQVEKLRLCTHIKSKGHLVVQKTCIIVDGTRTTDLYEDARKLFGRSSGYCFDELVELQRTYLERFWASSDIAVFGDEKLQQAVRFQLFHLLQSVGKDEISNISAKGLTGEGYEGHYFWDTEIYVLPLLQLTQPELAKQLLLYRFHILPQAKARAKVMGHKKGAAYPWRTISGIECSSYFPAGTAQYHINADIAYGFIQYHLYHKDYCFLIENAAEVIFETARIWLEIGHWYKGAYHIDNVTGPDEYTAIVNNNFYTNAMAKYHLYWAAKLYHELLNYNEAQFSKLCQKLQLSIEEVNEMQMASELMFLPYDEELGIHAQDDSFLRKAVWDFASTKEEDYPLLLHFHPLTIYRYQVLKQADTVLAHFLLEDYVDMETMKRSYDYYEKITTHDSSLSSCIYGIMASKCGYSDKAYDYFMQSVMLDLEDKHGNTKDGLHMANLAGSCLGIIYGFAGYRIKETGISISPILPSKLEGYSFRVHYLDSWIEVQVKDRICVRLLHGKPLHITVYNKEYEVSNILEIERKQE